MHQLCIDEWENVVSRIDTMYEKYSILEVGVMLRQATIVMQAKLSQEKIMMELNLAFFSVFTIFLTL